MAWIDWPSLLRASLAPIGLALVVGCGDSAELKQAMAKYYGFQQALRESKLNEVKLQIDPDPEAKARAEKEHEQQRDLEAQINVARMELIAAGGDPDYGPPLTDEDVKFFSNAEAELREGEAKMDAIVQDIEESIKKLDEPLEHSDAASR